MGPNYFCWQPICRVPYDLNSFAWYVKPRSYNDVQLVIDIIMKHRNTFDQYRWVKEMVLLPVYQTLCEDVSVTCMRKLRGITASSQALILARARRTRTS